MKRLRPGAWLAATCGLFSIFLLGCPGTLDPGVGVGLGGMAGSGGGGCEVPILASCALCHATNGGSAGLDLMSANRGPAMLGKMSSAAAGGDVSCMGQTLLNAHTTPATGLFVDKITLDTPCGQKMPLGAPLTPAEVTCLTDWATMITSTAPFIEEDNR